MSLSKREREVLYLLSENGAMYGLDMVLQSPLLNRGTIYVLLMSMADKGYVEPCVSGERRAYKATARGLSVYEGLAG